MPFRRDFFPIAKAALPSWLRATLGRRECCSLPHSKGGMGAMPPCQPIALDLEPTLELALNRLVERAADDLSLLFPGEADEVDGVARDADGQRGVELGVVVGIHQGLAV